MAVKNQPIQPIQSTQSTLAAPDIQLQMPKEVTMTDPIVIMGLSQEQVIELSFLVGKNISSPEDLLSQCRKLTNMSIEGEAVHFEPGLITRLRSRCPTNVDFGKWLSQRVVEWAHGYCGW